jgi:hypothetical protein
MPLETTIFGSIFARFSKAQDFASAYWERPKASDIVLLDGIGINQADRVFSDSRTVAASTNDDLDLSGALLDPFGVVVTFAKVKAIVIKASAANTTNLTIGNGATPFIGPFGAAAHTIQLQPGGEINLVAPQTGWTVTNATADILRIANAAGATAAYDIDIIGTSA